MFDTISLLLSIVFLIINVKTMKKESRQVTILCWWVGISWGISSILGILNSRGIAPDVTGKLVRSLLILLAIGCAVAAIFYKFKMRKGQKE